MSMSGVAIKDECISVYSQLQKRKDNYLYIVFKVSDDDKFVEIDKTGDTDETYDDFLNAMKGQGDQCRFGVFDVPCDGWKKPVFFNWNGPNAKLMHRMIYTSTREDLKKKLMGLHADFQCNDDDEMQLENIQEQCKSKTK